MEHQHQLPRGLIIRKNMAVCREAFLMIRSHHLIPQRRCQGGARAHGDNEEFTTNYGIYSTCLYSAHWGVSCLRPWSHKMNTLQACSPCGPGKG